jgi:hypothetical protein
MQYRRALAQLSLTKNLLNSRKIMLLTKLLNPTYTQMLKALSAWLDKARKQLPEAGAEALLSACLASSVILDLLCRSPW